MAATRQGRGKRQLLEENDFFSTQLGGGGGGGGGVKLFARLTELMSTTLARAVAIFSSRQKAQKSLNIVTLPL